VWHSILLSIVRCDGKAMDGILQPPGGGPRTCRWKVREGLGVAAGTKLAQKTDCKAGKYRNVWKTGG
jgi:hypothetical protein